MKEFIKGLMSVGKVLLRSRRAGRGERKDIPGRGERKDRAGREERKEGDTLVVMGNGPSLRKTIDKDMEALQSCDRMAVNFAANSPEYTSLCPTHYVLADPHFFEVDTTDANVRNLWHRLAAGSWEMTLHVPTLYRGFVERKGLPANIKPKYYNLTPGEGSKSIIYPLFRSGLAMPRPRNVMIPAIMEGIRSGYKKIVLVGADHSWHQSLWVDDYNRVVSVQPHFYKDKEDELERVAREYAGYHLHDIFNSMRIAFRSYHEIAAFARTEGVEIVNSTEGSMIDAFPREYNLEKAIGS